MKNTNITITRLKKSIRNDEAQWVAQALEHAKQDVINEATMFAYLNDHFTCFEVLAPRLSIENSYNLIRLTCEYKDLEYFKILMQLPHQPKTLDRMIAYGAREDFFEGFLWGVESFSGRIDGMGIMVEALQSGPQYIDIAYRYFPHFSTDSLKRIEHVRNSRNCSPETLSVIDASCERLKALVTQDVLVNTIGTTNRQRERKL